MGNFILFVALAIFFGVAGWLAVKAYRKWKDPGNWWKR